jgi:hypothetical protein
VTSNELDGLDVGALRRLLDRQAIIDCINRYARGVDRGDEALLQSAYHPDAVEDHAGGYVGAVDGLIPYLAAAHRPFQGYQRFVTNFSLEFDGDEAHAESYYLCILRRDEDAKLFVNGGRYVDRLERRDGEWRIAATVLVADWSLDPETTLEMIATGATGSRDRDDVSYDRPLEVTRERTDVVAS